MQGVGERVHPRNFSLCGVCLLPQGSVSSPLTFGMRYSSATFGDCLGYLTPYVGSGVASKDTFFGIVFLVRPQNAPDSCSHKIFKLKQCTCNAVTAGTCFRQISVLLDDFIALKQKSNETTKGNGRDFILQPICWAHIDLRYRVGPVPVLGLSEMKAQGIVRRDLYVRSDEKFAPHSWKKF